MDVSDIFCVFLFGGGEREEVSEHVAGGVDFYYWKLEEEAGQGGGGTGAGSMCAGRGLAKYFFREGNAHQDTKSSLVLRTLWAFQKFYNPLEALEHGPSRKGPFSKRRLCPTPIVSALIFFGGGVRFSCRKSPKNPMAPTQLAQPFPALQMRVGKLWTLGFLLSPNLQVLAGPKVYAFKGHLSFCSFYSCFCPLVGGCEQWHLGKKLRSSVNLIC